MQNEFFEEEIKRKIDQANRLIDLLKEAKVLLQELQDYHLDLEIKVCESEDERPLDGFQ